MTYDQWKSTDPADDELGEAEGRFLTYIENVYGRDYHHYRGYVIHYEPPPVPTREWDWHYQHEDFDGAPDGNDNRYGHCASLEACKGEIDDQIEDDEFEAQAAKALAPYRRPLREEEQDI